MAPAVRGLITLCSLPFAALLLLLAFPFFVICRATLMTFDVFERFLPDQGPDPPTD